VREKDHYLRGCKSVYRILDCYLSQTKFEFTGLHGSIAVGFSQWTEKRKFYILHFQFSVLETSGHFLPYEGCSVDLQSQKFKQTRMLIIDTRESESLDKALKKYKKKFEKAGILRELRRRQAFTKKSVAQRTTVLKAVYRNDMQRKEEA
jgi:small subunit ribosomal protein S21